MFSLRDPEQERMKRQQEQIFRRLQEGKRQQLLAERAARGEWTRGDYTRSWVCALALPIAVMGLLLLFIVFARETVALVQTIVGVATATNATLNVTLSNASGLLVPLDEGM